MLSGSCGTRDEPYIPRRRADASVLKRGLSWGHLLNIYKLKATSCGLFASGNRVPEFTSGAGCSFRLRPRWETPSHSKGEFWDALSETPSIRKVRPTLNTSSERMRACHPGRPRHRGDGKYRPKRLPRLRPQVSRKKPRESRGFHVCTIERAASRATVYSPKTAFLAAAAMLSRSSLVGWSFAATQLSSSILNRALSGSCSSMAS